MALPTLRMISTLTLLALVACRKEPPPDTGDSTPEGPEDTGPDEDLDNTYELCEDTTWSGEVVVGSVYYVCPTATLTIEPGAVVAFKPGSGLVIDGVLRADGTTHAPILFRTNYSISGSNYGVAVGSSGDSSSLSFASFVSIDLRLEGGAMAGVADVAFSDATLGVYSRTDPFTVARLSFADNEREDQTALIARDLPQLNVSESTFFKVAVGILFDGVQDEAALTLDDITFQDNRSAVVVGSIGDYVHTVSATELDISDSTSDALVFSNANVTLTDVSITDTKGSGVTGDINTALTLYDVTVSGTTDVGINVVGSIEAELLTVEGSESSGIYAGKMGSTFTTVAVSDVQGYGLYSTGDLTVDAAVVSNTTSTAIYASRGDLTVTNSLASEILGSGIYATYGDVVVRDTWLEHLEAHGIYASTASITLSDVSIEDVRSNGVYAYRSDLVIEPGTLGTRLEAIDGTGLYATDGDIVVENVSLVDVRGTGIYARYGSVTVIDSGLQDIVGTGIYGYFGDVTVSGAVLNPPYSPPAMDSSVGACDPP